MSHTKRLDAQQPPVEQLPPGLQAVVLVGGQGTRLRPLTLTTPKPLVPLTNRPVIEHIVRWLERYAITEIFLATQYQAAAFDRWLRRWQGTPVHAVAEPAPRGTAGAVAHLAERLHGTTIVVNGDNLQDLDLAALLAAHRAHAGVATIATDRVADPTGRGVVVSDHAGHVTEFQEKPAPGTARANTVNTGVYVLEPAALAMIPRDTFCNFEQQVFPQLIAAEAGLFAFQSAHTWIDTGTPDGYLRAQAAVLGSGASQPAGRPVAGRDTGNGLWQADAVNVDSAAQLSGGVALGFGTMIASHVRINASSIGRECHILPQALVERSAIWDGCMIEQGAAIYDSIIGFNCYIGAEARLDGAVVGDGCIIRSGAEVPAGTRLQPRSTYPG